jgi:spermidine/putrescine transport system substrate-binding protein
MKFMTFLIFLSLAQHLYADTLTLLNWEEYLSDKTIAAWEAHSGHKIHQVYFDNDEDRDNILLNHKDQVIDLAMVDRIASQIFGNKGILTPTTDDRSKPIMNKIDSQFQDSCGGYGIPYLWGTFGIVYRSDKILLEPTSWNFILQPKENMKQHIGLVDDFVDMLAPSLFVLGKSINTENPDDLKQAFIMIKNTLPSILTFEYSLSFIDADKNRDQLYAALAYSGDQNALNLKAGKNIWKYTTLKEGTITWVDCLTIMADSPRKEIIYNFLDFIYQPHIAAENSEYIHAASPLANARALQSKSFLSNTNVYPSHDIMKNAQAYKLISPKNIMLRNRITSSLIKSHESQ